mgnify:CR=1 FL=1
MPSPQTPFVALIPIPPAPPPHGERGVFGWLRANLFCGPLNIALTLVCVLLILLAVPPMIKFLLLDAVWSGSDRNACLARPERPVVGACWAFVAERINFFVYGFYPIEERWRVDLFFAALAFGIGWLTWLDAPRRGLGMLYFFAVLPVISFVLLYGAPRLGLPIVETAKWGGILVTVVVAAVGIVVALPIGILLALGRRSSMPAVRLLSVIYIEFVRGVPLITVLFMASVMLPLFLPEVWSPDKLLRALIGVAMFSAAYLAEVVRAATELGATRIQPLVTRHSVPKEMGEGKLKRLQAIAVEAAKQSGRLRVPEVLPPIPLNALPKVEQGMVAHVGARSLVREVLDLGKSLALAVGPEGGFAEEEVELLQEKGFTPVFLGQRILRAETAAIALLALCTAGEGR